MVAPFRLGQGITVGPGIQFVEKPFYLSASEKYTDGSLSGEYYGGGDGRVQTSWSNGSFNRGILQVGDIVWILDLSGGSNFRYEGIITAVLYASGFGWAHNINVTGHSGTPVAPTSNNWKIVLA